MASYAARVELHSATASDYEILHLEMQKRGYQRTISADNGKVYWLPTGRYDVPSASVDLIRAREIAVEAAQQTGRASAVIVVERSGAALQGLIQKTN